MPGTSPGMTDRAGSTVVILGGKAWLKDAATRGRGRVLNRRVTGRPRMPRGVAAGADAQRCFAGGGARAIAVMALPLVHSHAALDVLRTVAVRKAVPQVNAAKHRPCGL